MSVLLLFAALALGMEYYSHRDDIAQKHEESMNIHNTKLKESANIYWYNDTLTVINLGPDVISFNGIMIKCDNGMIFTESINLHVQDRFDTTIPDPTYQDFIQKRAFLEDKC